MRWAEANVNPMLTLRTALCNGRWQTMWQQLQQSPRCNSKPPACAASTDEFKVAIVSTKDCERLAQVVRKGAKGKPCKTIVGSSLIVRLLYTELRRTPHHPRISNERWHSQQWQRRCRPHDTRCVGHRLYLLRLKHTRWPLPRPNLCVCLGA